MNKTILSVMGAFISLLCVVVSLTAFVRTGEALTAILAVVFAFGVVCGIVGCVEDTELADKMSNMFTEEGGDDE